jgi:hypothetical protein
MEYFDHQGECVMEMNSTIRKIAFWLIVIMIVSFILGFITLMMTGGQNPVINSGVVKNTDEHSIEYHLTLPEGEHVAETPVMHGEYHYTWPEGGQVIDTK